MPFQGVQIEMLDLDRITRFVGWQMSGRPLDCLNTRVWRKLVFRRLSKQGFPCLVEDRTPKLVPQILTA